MRKVQLFYIAFILLILGGCTNNELAIFDDSPTHTDGSIAFHTDSVITRGTPYDNLKAYKAVHLIAYSHKGKYADAKSLYRKTVLEKGGNDTNPTWDYTPHMFWPEGHDLSFLAYSSDIVYTENDSEGLFINGDASIGAPVIDYVVPRDATRQPDLLVATLLNHKKVNNVTLPMKHALSCVSFCATGPADMRVKQITVHNVYSRASLQLDTTAIAWTLDTTSKGITFTPGLKEENLEEDPDDNNYLMTVNGYLMMIPQTLTDAYIDVVYSKGATGAEKAMTYTLPTTLVWEPGKKYIYKFGEIADEVVVYYERYTDGSYGLHSHKSTMTPELDDTKDIAEAGYGILSKSNTVSSKPTIKLGGGNWIPTTKIPSVSGEYNLYPINQTGTAGTNTFVLPVSPEPADVFFDGNNVASGKIIPHFAKGVYDWNDLSEYAIRTPQQLRNISALTTGDFNNPTYNRHFMQERDLDFSEANKGIGGGTLDNSIVDQAFCGTYNTLESKSISNVTITTSAQQIGLFSVNNGSINDIILKASSITGGAYVGGIVGENYWSGNITRPRVIGIAPEQAKMITITGTSSVGGIVGVNRGTVIGNTADEIATEITVAEVSGWVAITGSSDLVGGIAGHNALGSLNTVLVNGVLVTGANLGDLDQSKITITGQKYVGGIAGKNDVIINGNITQTGKNMPDVAGIIEINGTEGVGGIVGQNAESGKLESVNIRLGRTPAMIIKGTGDDVGGIVGDNRGTLGVESSKTFISARGNIEISGANHVGGIVGNNNSPKAELRNCFVYDFQSQGSNPTYYAPKIMCTGTNAGGIAGRNVASISHCSVFSTSGASLFITSQSENAGGIVGFSDSGSNTEYCSLVGRIEVSSAAQYTGGIFGQNAPDTKLSNCWVGNSDGYNILKEAQQNLGLVVTPPAGTTSYGIPYITGNAYIGGIVGGNAGIVDGITLSDNVTIGRKALDILDGSNWVGGIVGGNTIGNTTDGPGTIRNCTVANQFEKTVIIQGSRNLGGIAGLNNGLIEHCEVKAPTENTRLTIQGAGTIGGIVGQNGGHVDIEMGTPAVAGSGNDLTIIRNNTVSGYVTILGHPGGYETTTQVGGIIGLNGPTKDLINNIANCAVKGSATGSIVVSVGGTAGGIAGTNSGNINECEVQNAAITSVTSYAGGIAGRTSANATAFAKPASYRCNINGCKIYTGITVGGSSAGGALVGYLDATVGITLGNSTNPNQVNTSGVTVNGAQPAQGSGIVGYATGGATIEHTVTAVSP